jgi:hypothetical protein
MPANRPALDELHRRLEWTRRLADHLSYRSIAKLSPVKLSSTTVSRMFTSSKPPSWSKLRGVLQTLGVPSEHIVGDWHSLWVRAANEAHPLPASEAHPLPASEAHQLPAVDAHQWPAADPLTPVSFEHLVCRKCGAQIADAALHGTFHQWVEYVAARFNALERPANRVSKPSRIQTATPKP